MKKEAEEKFKTAAALSPENPFIPMFWGMLLYEQERYEEAIKQFEHSSLFSPDKYDVSYYTAMCYLRLGDYENALKHAMNSIALNPAQTGPYLVVGEVRRKEKNFELCMEAYESTKANAPLTAEVLIEWGISLEAFGRYFDAEEKFLEALKMEPNNEQLLSELSSIYLTMGDYCESERFLKRLLQVNPNNPQAYYNCATIKFSEKEYEEAEIYYKKALQLAPKNYALYYKLGECNYWTDNYDEAEKYYKKCIEYLPNHSKSYVALTNLLIEEEKYQEALRKARTLYTFDKTSPDSIFAYGIALMKSGMPLEAIEKLNDAIKIDSTFTVARLGIAECYVALKDYKSALDQLEMIMDKTGVENDYLHIQDSILCDVLADDTFTDVDFVINYCNKFLQRYNNSNITHIRDALVAKLSNKGQ